MICPHCLKDVPYKQRTGRKCGECKRRFALEPKETLLRTGDMRIRRVSEALSDGGALRYTPNQLFWRLARRRIRRPLQSAGFIAIGTFAALVLGVLAGSASVIAGIGVFIILVVLVVVIANSRERVLGRLPPGTDVGQVGVIANAWRGVYGSPLPGLASDEDVRIALQADPVEDFVAVVACADRDVLGCLALNGVAELFGVALLRVEGPGGDESVLDAGTPILFLHDVSAAGVGQLADARARWGEPRVIDVGLKVAHVTGTSLLPELHGPPVQLDPRIALEPAEREWLADGRSVALAAVKPSQLISAVERAVADLTAADAERRHARLAGFV
jgi:hypothetical protein